MKPMQNQDSIPICWLIPMHTIKLIIEFDVQLLDNIGYGETDICLHLTMRVSHSIYWW